jgi:hypothetical protein
MDANTLLSRIKAAWFSIAVCIALFVTIMWKAPGLESYLSNPDHGSQLSQGQQILLGKFPFRDMFTNYGPLTPFTSAAGLWISRPGPYSLMPETLFCVTGYALALFGIFFLVKTYASRIASIIATILGLLLMARFYKWYYWLFPVAGLVCTHQLLQNERREYYWIGAAGLLCGIGGLYRVDLGIALFCFYLICIIAHCFSHPDRLRALKLLGWFITAFSMPFLVWFTTLILHGGSVGDFFSAFIDGAVGVVRGLSLPFPRFDVWHPFSHQSSAAIGFVLVPLIYIACACLGLLRLLKLDADEESRQKSRFMIAVSIMGVGILPQALHRSDLGHLVQVLPPSLIAGSLVISEMWSGPFRSSLRPFMQFAVKALAIVCVLLVITTTWGLRRSWFGDLAGWEINPFPRLERLFLGTNAIGDHPYRRIIAEVKRHTRPMDRILVVGFASQMYLFTDRPMSGLFNIYAPGVFDNDKWRLRNVQCVQDRPPELVISKEGLFDMGEIRNSHPELCTYTAEHYTRVVYQQPGWKLLKKEQPQRRGDIEPFSWFEGAQCLRVGYSHFGWVLFQREGKTSNSTIS